MTSNPITFRLLGAIELSGPDGRPVRSLLAQPRRLALLLYLAATSHDAFKRKDTVRALFWPEADASHARRALNRAIYVLRQELGPGVLVTRGGEEVAVAEEHFICDVTRFQRALEAGTLETALDLYRGDLAPGFLISGLSEFEHWVQATRTRLREQAVEAAIQLADREAAAGRPAAAEGWARRAEALDPFDERTAARRICLLDDMGDRAAAIRAFEELERRLREELEVEPSPETRALISAVRSRREPRPIVRPGETRQSAGAPALQTAAGSVVPAQPRRASRRLLLIGAPVLLLSLVLTALLVRAQTTVLTTAHAIRITSEPGTEFQPALSPDGSMVAFTVVGDTRSIVAVRSVTGGPDGGEVRPAVSTTEDQWLPVWNSDGGRVRYVNTPNHGLLPEAFTRSANPQSFVWKEAGRLGGSAHEASVPRHTEWAAWSRDGAFVAVATHDSILVSDSSGHPPRLLLRHQGAWAPHSLAWSPDARWIAFVEGNPLWPGGWNTSPSRLWLVAVETGRVIAVTKEDDLSLNVSPAWLDSRRLLYVSDREGPREIYAVRIGPAGPEEDPVKVPGGTDAHSISVSADGRRLAVARAIARQNVRSFLRQPGRPQQPSEGQVVTSGSQVVETHDISENGEWIAYDTNLHGEADIYLQRLSGGAPIPFVTGPASAFGPRWSPDGREIAWYSGDPSEVHVASLDGGKPNRLGRMIGAGELPIWSPDGLSLVFRAPASGHTEAWIATRERIGASWGPARLLTSFGCAYQVWARDSSGLLCSAPGQTVLTLVAPSGAVLWRRNLAESGLDKLGPPALSPDGTTLYFRAARDRVAGIWALPLQGGEPRLIVTYEDPALQVLSYPGTINVTRDRLYITVAEFESDIWVMELAGRR